MLVSEFIDRTGYMPTGEEYAEIEQAYNVFKGDKDAYCRAWCKANPHKAGTYFARIKEQERQSKVFDNVAEFVRKCRIKRADFYGMTYHEQQQYMNGMCEKTRCKDRNELRGMVLELSHAYSVWSGWKQDNKELVWQFVNMA